MVARRVHIPEVASPNLAPATNCFFMIKIENNYTASSFMSEDQQTRWDKKRKSHFRVKLFGLTLFSKSEDIHVDFDDLGKSKIGFK